MRTKRRKQEKKTTKGEETSSAFYGILISFVKIGLPGSLLFLSPYTQRPSFPLTTPAVLPSFKPPAALADI